MHGVAAGFSGCLVCSDASLVSITRVHYALRALGIAPHPHASLTDAEMAQQLNTGVNLTRSSILGNATSNGTVLLQ